MKVDKNLFLTMPSLYPLISLFIFFEGGHEQAKNHAIALVACLQIDRYTF